MAIPLGTKIVKDTDPRFEEYAVGLSLPLQITNTAFDQTFETLEQVKYNIINLLSTKKGERLMQPEFGSGLAHLLFKPLDEDILEERIEEEIEDTISKWLPFITIEEIDIDMSDTNKDLNRVVVTLTFLVGDIDDLQEVTFTINN